MALMEGGHEPWKPLETGKGKEMNSTLEPPVSADHLTWLNFLAENQLIY